MRRREFITLLGGATAAFPLVASGQQRSTRIIGFLGANTPAAAGHLATAFVMRLRDLGWIEGQNLTIEYRWAAGQTIKFQEFATELIAAGVDVIVTSGDAPAKRSVAGGVARRCHGLPLSPSARPPAWPPERHGTRSVPRRGSLCPTRRRRHGPPRGRPRASGRLPRRGRRAHRWRGAAGLHRTGPRRSFMIDPRAHRRTVREPHQRTRGVVGSSPTRDRRG